MERERKREELKMVVWWVLLGFPLSLVVALFVYVYGAWGRVRHVVLVEPWRGIARIGGVNTSEMGY